MKKVNFFSDFKAFISKGNILDMAVGVIIGGAFGKIVSSLVADIIMPIVGKLCNTKSLANLSYPEAIVDEAGVVTFPEGAIKYGNFIMLIMVMGIVFEMPLLAWVLSCLGLINKAFLREYKSYAVVGLMVLSAVITPSGDPLSMSLVAVPLYLLYELSILIVREE